MAIALIDDTPKPELLLSAVLHLMSHYAASCAEGGPCPQRAQIIERHLSTLAAQPDLSPVLRATCVQLIQQWAGVVATAATPAIVKSGLLRRLVVGARH